MLGVLLVSIALSSVVAQNGTEESLEVKITQGTVRGYKKIGSDVFVFYGIPYATAPTGRQKFMPPLSPPQWAGIFEATDKDIICIQPFRPYSQENCLIANVYVPDTERTNLPVVVIVHGGAFYLYYGSVQEPIDLVNSGKIIAVSFNYRLGAHGFLCLGTEEVPGNAGMKDQVAMLRWVQENIAHFGGNPNDVTIMGCSAGGMSVDLLSVSPMAKGLFHKVIVNSGASVGPLSFQVDPLENARSYAKALGFDRVDDIDALEEFYKTVSYETLISRLDVIIERTDSSVVFMPCVEADMGTERFLEDAPVNLLRSQNLTRYPMMYGYAEMEGLFNVNRFDDWKQRMNENFSEFLPADLQFETSQQREEVAAKIKMFYFENEGVRDTSILAYLEYFKDIIFAHPILRTIKLHWEYGDNPIYLYEYSFVDENTPYIPHTFLRGANHCEQTVATFDQDTTNATEEYLAMKEIMRELHINFITLGVPVPEGSPLPAWPPINHKRSPHMSIGTSLQLLSSLNSRTATFLDSIYEQYYRIPIPPGASSAFQLMFSTLLMTLILIIQVLS
ncbi:venom carboxylesterase-6 [Amyelois transitella]|uniref:venom carboxylesterase-6 n=1 Tax=Amyelois transitella TaxID=680683 RepID=UPI00298F5B87|nr:venom carboxylesterase-6 [Amyelois transitella]